jgi:hypothetical protein
MGNILTNILVVGTLFTSLFLLKNKLGIVKGNVPAPPHQNPQVESQSTSSHAQCESSQCESSPSDSSHSQGESQSASSHAQCESSQSDSSHSQGESQSASSHAQLFVKNEVPSSLKTVYTELGCESIEEMFFVTEDDFKGKNIPQFKIKAFLNGVAELKAKRDAEKEHMGRVASFRAAEVEVQALQKLLYSSYITIDEFEINRIKILEAHNIEVVDEKVSRKGLTVYPKSKGLFMSLHNPSSGAIVPGGEALSCEDTIPLDEFADGDYEAQVYVPTDLSRPDPKTGLPIKKFPLKKNGNMVTPNFFDTGCSNVNIVSKFKNKGAKGKTTVRSDDPAFKNKSIIRDNDEDGKAVFPLPPGPWKAQTPAGEKMVHVPERPPLLEEPEEEEEEPQEQVVHALKECDDFSLVVSSIGPGIKEIAVCGDVSGSMSSGNLMDILKRSFRSLLSTHGKDGTNVRLYSWNTDLCPAPRDRGGMEGWINALRAGGGNDMRTAITKAFQDYPAVTDMFVMCDGDVSPFSENDWKSFASSGTYSKIRFHFIALGSGAQHDVMSKMASAGRGNFTSML